MTVVHPGKMPSGSSYVPGGTTLMSSRQRSGCSRMNSWSRPRTPGCPRGGAERGGTAGSSPAPGRCGFRRPPPQEFWYRRICRCTCHRARASSRGWRGGIVGPEAAGVLQAVHLPVEDGVTLLDPAVVAPADDLTLDRQHGADRVPALAKPLTGFFEGRLQKKTMLHVQNISGHSFFPISHAVGIRTAPKKGQSSS